MKEEIYYCDICGEQIQGKPRNSPDIKRRAEDGWSKPEEETIHTCLDCGHPWIDKVHQTFEYFLVEDNEVVGLEDFYYDRDELEDKRYVVFLEDLNQEEHGNVAVIESVVEDVNTLLQGKPITDEDEEPEEDEEESEDIKEIEDNGDVKIQSINRALERIRLKAEIKNVVDTNEGRHKAIKTKDGIVYWVLYKREFFHKYGQFFEGESGEGESINQHPLHEALKYDVDYLLYVYEDGNMAVIEPEKVKEYAEEHDTIRNTNYGETTYSFPVDLLEEWNP